MSLNDFRSGTDLGADLDKEFFAPEDIEETLNDSLGASKHLKRLLKNRNRNLINKKVIDYKVVPIKTWDPLDLKKGSRFAS